MWHVRMLGRFEAVSDEAIPAVFRSRKVGSLLAFLSLNADRPISNAVLQEMLWPESDGSRQSQSLRRALSDLRDALEDSGSRGAIVQTEQGTTRLAEGCIKTDVETFTRLLNRPVGEEGFDVRAAEAVGLYGGPLLAPLEDDWVFAYRRQYEQTFCDAVIDLCGLLSARGQADEAVRIALSASVLAPLREEPFVAAIRAYTSTGEIAAAVQQYEALERMLDYHFGETPSEAAQLALESGPVTPEASAKESNSTLGGAIASESRFYIAREADRIVDEALAASDPVVLVFGPRQTGKTSLLARSASRLRREGVSVAVTDFQSLSKAEFESPTTLYRALVHGLSAQLRQPYEPSWNEWLGPNSNFDELTGGLMQQTEGRICWVMDEVDRIFGTAYADDFFGLVRSWHNRRALDPAGPWKRITLLMSYATEAHLFIKDLNQSPFNIGIRVNVTDFTKSEVTELGSRYSEQLAGLAEEVYEVTHGHPFLARRAFSFLAEGRSVAELSEVAPKADGPFGDHLRRFHEAVERDHELAAEVRRFLRNEPLCLPSTADRLVASGLLAKWTNGRLEFRVPAYRDYLSEVLI